jgi:hypothetical protein
MAKQRLNQDEAFKNLMGIKNDSDEDNPNEPKAVFADKIKEDLQLTSAKERKVKNSPTSFYITDKHRKALKMKTALSDKPEDKDFSSIVRAALDIYLADIIKDL